MSRKLLFFGDIYISGSKKAFLDDDLLSVVNQHDLASCNFEGSISDPFAKPISKAGPHICQHETAADLVQKSGFNVINLANNHIYDYGKEALEKTLKAFENVLTLGVGLDFESAYKLKVKHFEDVNLGFLSFCESEFGALTSFRDCHGGYAWINHPIVNKLIVSAKKEVDVLIVQAHAGVEEISIPLPEWRFRYQELIGLGADALIAHHPHVPQGWEVFDDKPIFYSLGNFYFDMESIDPLWNRGYGVSLTIKDRKLSEFKVLPIEKKKNKTVGVCKDESFILYLQEISDLLQSEEYLYLIDEISLELWEKYYRSYYESALNSAENMKWKRLIKLLSLKVLGQRIHCQRDYLLLLHNLRIESHRWTVERALSLLMEKK